MRRIACFQQTVATQASFSKYGRKNKRELFLDQMSEVVPRSELLALVEPVYPRAGASSLQNHAPEQGFPSRDCA